MKLQNSTLPTKRATPRRTNASVPLAGEGAKILHPGRQVDLKHLAELRAFGCWACRLDGDGWVAAETHHPRVGQGTATKADDRDAIPLCPRHHNEKHENSLSIHRDPSAFRISYGTEAGIRDAVAAAMKAAGDSMMAIPIPAGLDAYHVHEVTDRLHVVICLIEDHVASHPLVAASPALDLKISKAIKLLADAYQESVLIGWVKP